MASLLARHRPADLVAFGDDRVRDRTAADLLADAAVLAAALPEPSPGSHVVLLFTRDRYHFAAALVAAWSRGHAIALPPNQQRDTVAELLARSDTVAMLHDTDAGGYHQVPALLSSPEPAPAPLTACGLPTRPQVATLFTSGTSGASDAIGKSGNQLLSEAEVLASRLLTPGSRLVATVPPGHIYGLLFGVLAPLAGGASFSRTTPFLPEEIAAAAAGCDILVTVPAHLRACGALAPDRLSHLQRVISSTAPLSAQVAAGFEEAQGVAITQIFGSTETGGIALREGAGATAWTPLPRVSVGVTDSGQLTVASPFATPGLADDAAGPRVTQDLVELAADGLSFEHRGRADRVKKIGGRRLSLAALEQAMQSHPAVTEAAVIAVDHPTGRGLELLAAVTPELAKDVVDGLLAGLAERFDRPCLPRRVVTLQALPRQKNGKLMRRRLLEAFGRMADGRKLTTQLTFRDRACSEVAGDAPSLRVTARVRVPETFARFAGHFPTYPILPGVSQLHDLVLPAIRDSFADLVGTRLETLTRLKFLGRIQPGDDVELELVHATGTLQVAFTLRVEAKTAAAGTCTFVHVADHEPAP